MYAPYIDQDRKFPVVMQKDAHLIEQENYFYLTGIATIDNDEQITFTMRPPAGEDIHLEFRVEGIGPTKTYIRENVVYDPSSAGTMLTPMNRNRNSSKTSVCSLRALPALTDSGDLIVTIASGARGVSGLIDDNLILKSGVETIVIIESGGNGNIISYRNRWSEV